MDPRIDRKPLIKARWVIAAALTFSFTILLFGLFWLPRRLEHIDLPVAVSEPDQIDAVPPQFQRNSPPSPVVESSVVPELQSSEPSRAIVLTAQEKQHLVEGSLRLIDDESKNMRELRIGGEIDQVEYEARLIEMQLSYAEEVARLQMLDDDSYEVLSPKSCDKAFFEAMKLGYRVSHSPARHDGELVRALFVFRPERFPELYALRQRESIQRPGLAAALLGLFDMLPADSKTRICSALRGELRIEDLAPSERRFLTLAATRLISIEATHCRATVR